MDKVLQEDKTVWARAQKHSSNMQAAVMGIGQSCVTGIGVGGDVRRSV